jgi:hypothetical protein
MRLYTPILLVTITLCVCGCQLLIPWIKSSIDGSCYQTFEFANNGCAELVVIVGPPPGPLPDSYFFSVGAVPLRRVSDIGFGGGQSYDEIPATTTLRLIRWDWGPGDTASAWIVAEVVDRKKRIISTGQNKTVAIDSVLHVVRFAPIGERPVVDTVRLTLLRP